MTGKTGGSARACESARSSLSAEHRWWEFGSVGFSFVGRGQRGPGRSRVGRHVERGQGSRDRGVCGRQCACGVVVSAPAAGRRGDAHSSAAARAAPRIVATGGGDSFAVGVRATRCRGLGHLGRRCRCRFGFRFGVTAVVAWMGGRGVRSRTRFFGRGFRFGRFGRWGGRRSRRGFVARQPSPSRAVQASCGAVGGGCKNGSSRRRQAEYTSERSACDASAKGFDHRCLRDLGEARCAAPGFFISGSGSVAGRPDSYARLPPIPINHSGPNHS